MNRGNGRVVQRRTSRAIESHLPTVGWISRQKTSRSPVGGEVFLLTSLFIELAISKCDGAFLRAVRQTLDEFRWVGLVLYDVACASFAINRRTRPLSRSFSFVNFRPRLSISRSSLITRNSNRRMQTRGVISTGLLEIQTPPSRGAISDDRPYRVHLRWCRIAPGRDA
jgi:hypothetical protein